MPTQLAVVENLEVLQSKTLAAVVQQEMLRMLKAGELEMGAKLSEINFTSRLGVSRAAVREAFRALEEAGLVRLTKNRGVFVREFSRREAEELYELRAIYEEAAARRLTATITEEQIDALGKLNQRLEKLGPRHAIDQYYPQNIVFHQNMVKMTGNAALSAAYERVTDQMHLLRRRGYGNGPGLMLSSREHRLLLQALLTRDPDAVGKAAHDHVMAGMQRFLAV